MTGNNSRGFSLFEMLLVVAMVGILAMATVPVAELIFIKAKEGELEQSLAQIKQAISLWKRDCRNAVVQQYGYDNLLKIPDSRLHPPSLLALMRPDLAPELVGGKFVVLDENSVARADFYPKAYLQSMPIDPFVGAGTWLIHYASGTNTAVFANGTVTAPPADHVGVFDISCVDNTGNRRRGFVQAIDGTNYTDW